jgi:hypothetical protein
MGFKVESEPDEISRLDLACQLPIHIEEVCEVASKTFLPESMKRMLPLKVV